AKADAKTQKHGKTPEAQRNTAVLMLAHALEKTGAKATLAFSKDAEAYLDFQGKPVNAETLKVLQTEMEKLRKEGLPVSVKVVTPTHAFSNEFLAEAARESGENQLLLAGLDGRDYLLPGPFCASTKDVAAFQLTKFGGAYWKNNAKNASLQRIHVQAFKTDNDRKTFLELQKKAEARDHRKIGKQMDLFSIHEEGTGFVFWHPNGMVLFKELEKLLREEYQMRDYSEIRTPIILNEDLWHRSGHWDHYKENMYFTQIDGVPHAVKPMNCPGAILVYKTRPRSYRDLPLRLAENGIDHRHELSGVLSGLFRVRAFTQDDAHLFVTQDQILDEVTRFIDFIDVMYKTFGFSYAVELSTKPEKAMGDAALWEKAEAALTKALKQNKKPFDINEGDGAFYGPKIDFKIKDALGREWQCGTIQLDFQMPERFELTYESPHGKKRPVMLHRVIYGSFERFLGILIEHYAGTFPAWLAPEQVRVLPLTDNENDYAESLKSELKQHGIRVTADTSSGKLEGKIRDAQMAKVPYMLVVGQKERDAGTVSVRKRDGSVTHGVKREAFQKAILQEIRLRAP
ncbi:MAG: threonine--tRNA ligase, partial [Candidatus Micrarchaeota archaeon]|nr:threonine--tRNA ligase [Candidatus Micrarchaeota archaeon]